MPCKYVPVKEQLQHAEGRMVIKINIDREAYALLQSWAPSKKAYGEYISRLVYEQWTRIEERARMKKQRRDVLSST